jgi:hypothetical protein
MPPPDETKETYQVPPQYDVAKVLAHLAEEDSAIAAAERVVVLLTTNLTAPNNDIPEEISKRVTELLTNNLKNFQNSLSERQAQRAMFIKSYRVTTKAPSQSDDAPVRHVGLLQGS